jgi:hypothetical protein
MRFWQFSLLFFLALFALISGCFPKPTVKLRSNPPPESCRIASTRLSVDKSTISKVKLSVKLKSRYHKVKKKPKKVKVFFRIADKTLEGS